MRNRTAWEQDTHTNHRSRRSIDDDSIVLRNKEILCSTLWLHCIVKLTNAEDVPRFYQILLPSTGTTVLYSESMFNGGTACLPLHQILFRKKCFSACFKQCCSCSHLWNAAGDWCDLNFGIEIWFTVENRIGTLALLNFLKSIILTKFSKCRRLFPSRAWIFKSGRTTHLFQVFLFKASKLNRGSAFDTFPTLVLANGSKEALLLTDCQSESPVSLVNPGEVKTLHGTAAICLSDVDQVLRIERYSTVPWILLFRE